MNEDSVSMLSVSYGILSTKSLEIFFLLFIGISPESFPENRYGMLIAGTTLAGII
jgi:hypothetical protein